MGSQADEFISLTRHPVKFRIFLLTKIPSAFFSGLRIKQMDENSCTTTIKYSWFTKNPFRSTYFACLGMAAEMSTGALAMAYIYKREPSVSMLVTKTEAIYSKKAVGITQFTCKDGELIRNSIEKAIATGEGQTIIVKSTGTNGAGETVAEFMITWSFKMRNRK